MGFMMEDLIGLNSTDIADMPIVLGESTAGNLLQRATAANRQLSVMGMHHSQGGHAMLSGASLLITETMNKVEVFQQSKTVKCGAGATWTEIHSAANKHQLAPCVQQSSAHFTVGGSISVNCHGRDPRFGPIAETVVNMKVLAGDGQVYFTDRLNHPELFKAVIGGYGACGMILEATLKLTDNKMLSPNSHVYRNLADYQQELQALAARNDVHIHYGWLRCTNANFFDHVLSVNAIEDQGGYPLTDTQLNDESWGVGEILRAGWDLSRTDPYFKDLVWRELEATQGSGSNQSRLNWLRSSVSFTASRGDDHHVDILQEYFVPLDQLATLIGTLKTLFTNNQVNVMSSTIRLVRPDTMSNLSYSPDSTKLYASIAVDVHVGVITHGTLRTLDAAAENWILQSIQAAIALGGSYYLPYYKVADRALFQRAYPAAGIAAQRDAIGSYNGGKRFWNRFLDAYF